MHDIIDYASWSRDDLIGLAAKLKWIHQIDLGGGFVTPGQWPPNPMIEKALADLDFRGKKVLDIGCWDGLYAFAAEQRGASEVYATDLLSSAPRRSTGLSRSRGRRSSPGRNIFPKLPFTTSSRSAFVISISCSFPAFIIISRIRYARSPCCGG
jgi:hypothetical protein